MFSGAVKLGDLNDYIAPSQACVVALQGGKLAPGQDDTGAAAAAAADDGGGGGGVVLQRKRRPPRAAAAAALASAPTPKPPTAANVGFKQTYTEPPREGGGAEQGAVRVTLHDCLACSGCVTSAETVLLQQQSAAELLQRLSPAERPAFDVVVSVSPQSRASLAALHGLPSAADAHLRLATFFKKVLGARAVLDLGVAREVALLEAGEEFCARFAASGALWRASERLRAAGAVRAAAAADAALLSFNGGAFSSCASPPSLAPLPVLASACPGWVCYAEKTKGAAPRALPHLSAVRSPQGVMGALVKARRRRHQGQGHGRGQEQGQGQQQQGQQGGWGVGSGGGADGLWGAKKIYHVTVMPCYDKKLEAARDELVVVVGSGGGSGSGGKDGGGVEDGNGNGSSGAQNGGGEGGGTGAGAQVEPEVDCCLATSEVQALLEAHGCADLASVEPAAELDTLDGRAVPAAAVAAFASAARAGANVDAAGADAVDQPPLHDPAWGRPGSLPGTGGWAGFVMRYAARRLFGLELSPPGGDGGGGGGGGGVSGPLAPRRLRNADMHELALELRHALEAEGLPAGDHSGPPLLRFAAAYGFRNIQAVVRRLPAAAAAPAPAPAGGLSAGGDGSGNGGGGGSGGDPVAGDLASAFAAASAPSSSPHYDYVEVFACPGGCLNGGGQMAAAKAVAAAGAAAVAGGGVGGGGGGAKSATAALDELENYFASAAGPFAMDVDGAVEGVTVARWEPGSSAAVQRVYEGLASSPAAAAAGGRGERAASAAGSGVGGVGVPGVGSAAARAAFHTTFRRREATLASAVGDW